MFVKNKILHDFNSFRRIVLQIVSTLPTSFKYEIVPQLCGGLSEKDGCYVLITRILNISFDLGTSPSKQ